jgi:hypothetical protein
LAGQPVLRWTMPGHDGKRHDYQLLTRLSSG